MKRFTHLYRSPPARTGSPPPGQNLTSENWSPWCCDDFGLIPLCTISPQSFTKFNQKWIRFYCKNYVKTNFYLLNTKQLRTFLCMLSKITTFLDKSKVYVKLTFCTFKWVHTGNNKVLLIESWDRLIVRWMLSEHLLYAMLICWELAEKIDFTCTSSVLG